MSFQFRLQLECQHDQRDGPCRPLLSPAKLRKNFRMVLPDRILFAFHRFDATCRQSMRSNPDNP